MVVVNISYAIGGHTLAATRYEIPQIFEHTFPCVLILDIYVLFIPLRFLLT